MDLSNPMVRDAFSKVEAGQKSSVPWKVHQPYRQPFYSYSTRSQTWEAQQPDTPTTSQDTPITTLAVYSWNIDFMTPFAEERMSAALDHLLHMLFPSSTSSSTELPSIHAAIYFQELTASDLKTLQAAPWVQSYFHITDLDPSHWANAHYGTTTLIDRRLPINSTFRVHYADTKMDRDGLFVDITLPSTHSDPPTIRLCNTHLESLISSPPLRPLQLTHASTHLHSPHISHGILAGDLNAIQPFDATLHLQPEINLRDAFLDAHPSISDPMDAFARNPDTDTWGFTAPTTLVERFGTTRMDKILFCSNRPGRSELRVRSFERFGRDVLMAAADEVMEEGALVLCAGMEGEVGFPGKGRGRMTRGEVLCEVAGTERPWATDHLGVMGVFDLVHG